jgi:hypothetical protein
MKVPVDASDVVVNPMGELASPPAGGVTDCGRLTAMPVGALPTQETENVTGELKPPREFTVTEVPPLSPGIVDTVSEDGLTEKSETTTGARTDGVPAIVTWIWVECESTLFVAVTMSVYVPVEGEGSAVRVRVEDALPPAGMVTGLRRLTVTPAGATPVQTSVRLTEELNPFIDESIMVVDLETSGVRVNTAAEGCVRKSGACEEATTVSDGVTINWSVAECDMPPLEAVTVNG